MTDRYTYLSELVGRPLTVRCARCKTLNNYAADDMLAKLGDCNVNGLKTTLARMRNCPRLYAFDYDRCKLDIEIGRPIEKRPWEVYAAVDMMLRKMEAYRASDAVKLGDLASWQHLYAACRCGHIGYVKRDLLTKRYGREITLGELRPKLKCRRSAEHKNILFAIHTAPR